MATLIPALNSCSQRMTAGAIVWLGIWKEMAMAYGRSLTIACSHSEITARE